MTEQVQPYTRAPDLPFFKQAPVTEVSVGLQLQGVKFRAVQLGDLHARFSDLYPLVEEHLPPPLLIEQFDTRSPSGVQFQFALLDSPPLPMLVFLAKDRSSLVQLHSNRFSSAWRRVDRDAEYPRYQVLRSEFIRNVEILDSFTTEIGIGNKPVSQAEIIYINDIPITAGQRPDTLAYRLPTLNVADTAATEEISAIGTSQHFTYKKPNGIDYARLHITAEPITVDSEPALRLSLVYRGEPHERFDETPGLSAIMRFLDEGHDRIVRAFVANTTPDAHKTWGIVG